jgi:Fic family protein
LSASGGGTDQSGQPPLPDDGAAAIARLEIENGFRQYDETLEMIQYYLNPERPFALRPGLIQQLQATAIQGLVANPGQWRSTPVQISKSKHQPPPPHLVPPLIAELCDYVNDNFHERPPLHLAAFVMWRLNWIHPFEDGNGRTSRAISYLVLCTGLKLLLPGSPTIPQQISEDRTAYFEALEEADAVYRENGDVDVSKMEKALKYMLAKQLLGVIEMAGGEKITYKPPA